MNNSYLKLGITTGDVDGVGAEVTAKALAQLGPKQGVQFILWRSPSFGEKHLQMIDQHFSRVTVNSAEEALEHLPNQHNSILDISTELSPAEWVKISAEWCRSKKINTMTTAPMSKTLVRDHGKKEIGHTEILQNVTKSKEVFMAFVGSKFNVLLVTGHCPLSQISSQLSVDKFKAAITQANKLRLSLPAAKLRKQPLALVGVNPHAGEEGLLGCEETELLQPVIQFARDSSIPIEGPLVPDAAFFPQNWSKYSVFVCPYHDLGLIPFKMVHGQDSGYHISMGLPFIRTSVDHGTAKNIFGKDQANPNSMKEALKGAIRLAKTKG